MIKEFVPVSILFRNSARATRDDGGNVFQMAKIDIEPKFGSFKFHGRQSGMAKKSCQKNASDPPYLVSAQAGKG